jgi:hypothetical protein
MGGGRAGGPRFQSTHVEGPERLNFHHCVALPWTGFYLHWRGWNQQIKAVKPESVPSSLEGMQYMPLLTGPVNGSRAFSSLLTKMYALKGSAFKLQICSRTRGFEPFFAST